MGLHSRQTKSDGIHGIVAWEWANSAARLAATGPPAGGTFATYDVFKIGRDIDTSRMFILVDDSPVTWKDIGNASVGGDLNKVEVSCRKSTSGTLTVGTVVQIEDYNHANDYALLEKSQSTPTGTELPVVGIIEIECSDSVTGKVLLLGVLHGQDTSGASAGDPVYASTTAGEWTTTAPNGPNIVQPIGAILNSDASNGHIGVNVLSFRALAYSGSPTALGTAAWGTANMGSPSTHVHPMPKLDDLGTPDDNTDLDVSIAAHGLTPKLPNDASVFLNGVGGYTAPVAVFGADYATVVSAGESSTGSTVFQLKVGMTTPALTGTYRVGWMARLRQSSAADRVEARCRNTTDSSNVGGEAIHEPKDILNEIHVGAFEEVVFTGAAKTFEIQYRQQAGSTAYISEARIEIWRVG